MPPKKQKQDADSNEKAAPVEPSKNDIATGDIITLDFDAWIVNPDGTEELFDTTSEEHAKAGDIFNEKAKYGSIVTIVGDGRVLPGLDKSFGGAKVGEKASVSIPPSEGAGERMPNMVEIFSVRELQKQEIDPEPGMRIQIKNRVGTITNMTSGRVRVDFNDPLAGKILKYDYTITKKAGTPEEMAMGILAADYGRSDEFKVRQDGDVLEIITADMCKYDQLWFTMKYKVVSDIRQFLKAKTVRFVEEYVAKEEPEEEAKPDQENTPDNAGPEESGQENAAQQSEKAEQEDAPAETAESEESEVIPDSER